MVMQKGFDSLMENAVIDDDLIAAALVEDGDRNQPVGSMATFELAQLVAQATTLSLSYRNVLEIDNLQGFHRLTKLCLDNNIIERICNLDHLVSLRWLDLSFNAIKRIEGLGALTRLMDLSLCNNQIAEIEGLDACQELQCLSLGNNRIAGLDNIVRLRQFTKLRLVSLSGNPVCKESEYKSAVLAYLKGVRFHDYAMVDGAERAAAREQYQDELLELEEKEALEAEKALRDTAAAKETAELRDANLLVSKTLFTDMFAADTEMVKLRHVPGMDDVVAQFRNHVAAAAETFRAGGFEKAAQKRREVTLFDAAVAELRRGYTERSVALVEEFNRRKKRAFKDLELQEVVKPADLEKLRGELVQLESELMDLELHQVEQHEQLLGEFETAFGELRAQCFELQQTFFRSVEEHEEHLFAAAGQLAQDALERAAKNELPEDSPDELANLLVDRDTCMNAVSGSHDIHVGKLLAREDETTARESRATADAVAGRARAERERNRGRVVEVRAFVDRTRAQINALLSNRLTDDFDEADRA
ncbi:unnamed protein product [Phaeothamnion confervicola]